MLDLSTINSKTIKQPATLTSVKQEVDEIARNSDANKASTLFSYLKRLLPNDPNDPIAQRYSLLLEQLANTSPSPSKELEIGQPSEARVPVRDTAGKVKFFESGHFIDQPATVFDKEKPKHSFGEFPKTVGEKQAKLESKSAHKPVPVAYESPEDEEEIRKNTDRLSSFRLEDGHNISFILDSLAKKNHLSLDNDLLKKRYYALGTARLKEIRNSKETQELLIRSPKVGGLGLEQTQAQTMIKDLDQASRQVREDLPAVLPKQVIVIPQAPAPTPPKVPDPIPSKKDNQLASQAAAALSSEAISQAVPVKVEEVSTPKPSLQPVDRSTITARRDVRSDKTVVEDIKAPERPRRLVSPIDELKKMSIEEFRQFGEDAGSQVRKVYEKINLLGQESFGKRIEGIQAWRQSPVHKLYLTMSRESLEQGRDMREIIKAHEIASEPFLSEAEYHAIVDLNRKLRF